MRFELMLMAAFCAAPIYETPSLRTRVDVREVCDACPRRIMGRREMSRSRMGVYTKERPLVLPLARDGGAA